MKDSKTYRIRTKLGSESESVINVQLEQTFDTFEILSLKLDQKNAYKLYQSDYGVIVGRVIANGGFGVPNAKVSIFIESEEDDDFTKRLLYPYKSTMATNFDGIRYNLLPDYVDDACHQNVGTFPNKRLVLDNNDIIDIYDKYYVYTTVTNNAGDYMIFGVPTGSQKLHVDLDLSDIGMLSQRPRDLMYKGYKETDFESPNKFKKSTNLNSLAQIYTQDKGLYVYPFWGDTTESKDNIAVTRCDIELSYKFEPTCVFMGSIVTDTGSNSISKNCAGATTSGKMSELVSGEGTIEMIRKTIDNKVESYQIRGNRLIDGDGVWCYQIPMNLDYIMTDEFGNIVPSDNPEKGIPTRTRVRFRISLDKVPNDNTARNRCQYLVPNNPRLDEERYPDFTKTKEVDYEFGTNTKDENYRDLFWNKVYTVKNYIPRLQKNTWVKNRKHTGIKLINHFGDNNPMPYNNMNIKLTFQYRLICVIAKVFINLIRFLNQILTLLSYPFCWIAKLFKGPCKLLRRVPWPLKWITKVLEIPICGLYDLAMKMVFPCIEISSEFCGDNVTHNYSFYPGCGKILFTNATMPGECITSKTKIKHEEQQIKDNVPQEEKTEVSFSTGELYNCVESSLAEDNDVVSFNFHNDWINGVLYAPLWFRKITPKKRLLFGLIKRDAKDQWCSSETLQNKKLKIFTPCAILREKEKSYNSVDGTPRKAYHMDGSMKCGNNMEKQNCLNRRAFIGLHNGIIVKRQTMLGEDVYYYQAVEFDHDQRTGNNAIEGTPVKEKNEQGSVKLVFATDIVLLGSLNDCDLQGVPQFFKSLESTTYKLPPTLLFTDNVMVTSINEEGVPESLFSDDGETITTTQESKTEMTGADWGNYNYDICPGSKNEEHNQDSGLFYSIGCNSQRTLPKSCINLSRICEFGVSLDESKHILTEQPTKTGSDDSFYSYLVPDGFISKDELYNIDERSAFASLNHNGLHTKLSEKTGLMEYDFDYVFVDNFDNSLRGHMEARQKRCNNSYKYNYWLEEFSDGYYDFRMGRKPYFYDDEKYNENLEKNRQPSGRSLPRYENSFYFYFGLKHGKTALDKFNSQFVSSCYDENEEFENIGVIAVGNDWCSDLTDNSRDGYIAIDLSMVDLPCEIMFKSLSDSGFTDMVIETNEEKIYICNWSREELDNMHYPSLEGLRLALTELEEKGYIHVKFDINKHVIKMFPNGTYEMTVTDKNGEITTVTFTLKSEYLKSSVVGTNFNYPDNVLLKRFNGSRDTIKNDTTDIEPMPVSIISTRDIGGTIAVSFPYSYNKVSGENEEIPYFIIEVSGIRDTNGKYTYNEYIDRKNGLTKTDGVIAYNENRNNNENGVALFGVPKPDECYLVKVTEYCFDMSTSTYTRSGNTVSYTVCIKEKQPFKLYINEVDYDLISDWNCGFRNESQNLADVKPTGNPSDLLQDVHPSDNWIHMSDKRRYRWYSYRPYQNIDKEFVRITDQIHNMFSDSPDSTVDGKTEIEFLNQFTASKYNALYNKHFVTNMPHVLYNINEDNEKEDDITKRSNFWQLDTSKFREEIIENASNRQTETEYVSDYHVSKDFYSKNYVHKENCGTITPTEYNTLSPEDKEKYYPLRINKTTYDSIENDTCKSNFSVRTIDDSGYNALYGQNMYYYTQTKLITVTEYNLMPDEERRKCTRANAYNMYRYTWVIVINEEEYNAIEGYTSEVYVNKNTCNVISPIEYGGLDDEEKAQYYSLEVDDETYNEMSSSCQSHFYENKSRCVQFNEGGKGDYYDLVLDEQTYQNQLNDIQKSYFRKNAYYVGEETELEVLLGILYDLTLEVDELQDEVVDNVKQTFQLNCTADTKTITYRAITDDKPITYHEVHKHERVEGENDFQTVECSFKYSNSYTVDEISIPTITTKDSKFYGNEDIPEPLTFLKFEMSGSDIPEDLTGNMSGVYNYNGTSEKKKLMFSVDNRATCGSDDEKTKKAYFVAVNNSRYPINTNKAGNTIPERYRTGDSRLGYMFGYHIIDKIFDINPLVWAITNNVPYFMKYVEDLSGKSPKGETIEERTIFENKLVYMNGLFTAQIRNGNASYYDTYEDGDKKRANFKEQEIGYVFSPEIYTYRENGETDEDVEDRMPTLRYVTGAKITVDIPEGVEGVTNSLTIKNYDNYAIGTDEENEIQDDDMWQHSEKKEYCTLTKYDERYTFKDDNDCELSDNIDSRLRIVLTEDSVNDCKNRENTKFSLKIENCSDEEGLIYYVFDAKDGGNIYYPINKAEFDDTDGMFVMDVGCEGKCALDQDTKIFEKDINKLQYLYTVYTKRGLKPYWGGFPFSNIGFQGTLGKYDTTTKLESIYENENTEQEYKAKGWSNTGEFTLTNKDDYPCVYSVVVTGNNTRTISPVYDYRFVCVTLIFGSVFIKKEILDENNAITGFDFTENGKMTFDVSNIYDCEQPNNFDKILYYFYNYPYKVTFECKLDGANTVQGSYTHTSYVNDPEGYVLFDLSEDAYNSLKVIYDGSRGSVGKRIDNDTKVEIVDVTGLKHIPKWRTESNCCVAYKKKCWASVTWITNGGTWKDTHEDGTYLIDAYTEFDGERYENDYYNSESDFIKLFEEGATYKPGSVGILTKDAGEGSTICPQEGEGGFLGWSTTPDGSNIVNPDQEITIDCDDRDGYGAQIYYAIWSEDIVGVQWLDCDGNELKKLCNVIKGAVLTDEDMPVSDNPDKIIVGWKIGGSDVDLTNGYEVTGDTVFTARCATACFPSIRLFECIDIGREYIEMVYISIYVTPSGGGTPKHHTYTWLPSGFGTYPSLSNEAVWVCPMSFNEGDEIMVEIDGIETHNGCMIWTTNGGCDNYSPEFSECNWAVEICQNSVIEGNSTLLTLGENCRGSQVKMVHKYASQDDCSCETPVRVIWRKDCPGDIHWDTFVCYGEYLILPAANPKKEGYTFDGWDDGYNDEILLNPITSETPTQIIDGVPTIVLCPNWKANGDEGDEEYTVEFLAEGNNLSNYTKQVNSGDMLLLSDIPEDSSISIPSGKTWPNNKWTHKTKVNGIFVTGSKYYRSEIPTIGILGDTQFVAEFEEEIPQTTYSVTFKVGECQIDEIQVVVAGGHATCPTVEDVEESECFTDGFDVFEGEWRLEGTNQTYNETYINGSYNIMADTVFVAVLTRLDECEYDFYWSIPEELENKDINGNPVTTDSLAHGAIPSGSVPIPPSDTPPTLNGFNYSGWIIRGGDGTPFDNNNIPAIMVNTVFDGAWIDTGKRRYNISWRVENYSSKTLRAGHFTLKVNCPNGVVTDSGTDISFGGDIQPYPGSGEPHERHGTNFVADTMPSDWVSLYADKAVVTCQVGNDMVDVTWTRDSGLLVSNTYYRQNSGNSVLVVKLYDTAPSYPVTFNAVDTNGNLIKVIKSQNVDIATTLDDSIIPSESYICSYASPGGVGVAYRFVEWDDNPYGDVVWSALTYNAKLEKKQYNVTFMWDSGNPSNIIVKMVYHGDYAEEPDSSLAPAKEGYTFSGWNPVPSETRITSNNVVFIGVWIPEDPDTANVTFVVQEQNSDPVVSWGFEPLSVDVGHTLTQNEVPTEEQILTKTGNTDMYEFVGWENGASPAGTPIDSSVTFIAYVRKKQFVVTFNVKDSNDLNTSLGQISQMTVDYGYVLTYTDIPNTQQILNATGNANAYDINTLFWRTGSTNVDFENGETYTITSRKTFSAILDMKSFTVTFNHNNGTDNKNVVYPYYGESVNIISAPTYDGYTFNYWSCNLDSNHYNPGGTYNNVTSDIIFTAQWTQDTPNTHTVTFVFGHDIENVVMTVEEGNTVTPPTAPSVEGYLFDGWSSNPNIPITQDMTFTAIWKIRVIFKAEGSIIDTQYVSNNGNVTIPTVTVGTGRRFKDKWTIEGHTTQYTNDTVAGWAIQEPLVLVAVVVDVYTVEFYADSVKIGGTHTVESGNKITPPTNSAIDSTITGTGKVRYESGGGGWRIANSDGTFNTYNDVYTNEWFTNNGITSNMKFYARLAYKVTFDFNQDDYNDVEQYVEQGHHASVPSAPSVENCEFTGWNSNVSGLNTGDNITANVTFTAQWECEEPQTGHTVVFLNCNGETIRTDRNVPDGTVYGSTNGYSYPSDDEASTFNNGVGCLFGGEWSMQPLTINKVISSDTTFTPVCSCSGQTYDIKFAVYNNLDSSSSVQFNKFSVENLNYTLKRGNEHINGSVSCDTINEGLFKEITINNVGAYSEINLNDITIKYNTGINDVATLYFNTDMPDEHGYLANIKLYKNGSPVLNGGTNITATTFAQSENGIYMTVVITYRNPSFMIENSNTTDSEETE